MTGTHTIHISTDGSFLLGARPVTGWAWGGPHHRAA